ncbi:DUF5060 domain-containing protein [Streptodolium elevatio]|uniref:DUF5060 domain-containing protein n=1 Tax=Streptodolium elevatio TaxID=3157996 RepID=A0ABV3DXD7_9ACTN
MRQWDLYELVLEGPTRGNPFVDVDLSARFTLGGESTEVAGFYDGEGTYRVRFMPEHQGLWTYETAGNVTDLNGRTGRFECVEPGEGNHGPVRVHTDGMTFRVEILDTWNMTVTPLDTLYIAAVDAEKAIAYAEGDATVKLPADPYLALRIQRVV